MKRIFALAVMMVFMVSGAAFAADTYKAELSHAEIEFGVKHLGLATVRGQFKEFDSTVMMDGDKISSVTTTIKVASIDTDNEKRDGHLMSADFFDAANFPEITFKSKGIKGSTITGDLTMRGKTKEVSFPFELVGPLKTPFGDQRLAVAAELTLNRNDYGVGTGDFVATAIVGGDVTIGLNLEYVLSTDATNAK